MDRFSAAGRGALGMQQAGLLRAQSEQARLAARDAARTQREFADWRTRGRQELFGDAMPDLPDIEAGLRFGAQTAEELEALRLQREQQLAAQQQQLAAQQQAVQQQQAAATTATQAEPQAGVATQEAAPTVAQSARERDAAAAAPAQEAAPAQQPVPLSSELTMQEQWDQATPEQREALIQSQALGTSSPESWFLGGLGLLRSAGVLGRQAQALATNRAQLESVRTAQARASQPIAERSPEAARRAQDLATSRPIAEAPRIGGAVAPLATAGVLDAATGTPTLSATIEQNAEAMAQEADPEAIEATASEDRMPSGVNTTRVFEQADFYLGNSGAITPDILHARRQRDIMAWVAEGHIINNNIDAAAAALSNVANMDLGMYTLKGMQAINEFTNNNNPLALNRMLSVFSGTEVNLIPNLDGTYNVERGGRITAEGADPQEIAQQATLMFSQQAQQQAAEMREFFTKESIRHQFATDARFQEIQGKLLQIIQQGVNSVNLEVVKAQLARQNIEWLGVDNSGHPILRHNNQIFILSESDLTSQERGLFRRGRSPQPGILFQASQQVGLRE